MWIFYLRSTENSEIDQKAIQKISFAFQRPPDTWKGCPTSFKNVQKDKDRENYSPYLCKNLGMFRAEKFKLDQMQRWTTE